MYADRHAPPEGIKPGSLIVAIGINAGLVAALLFVTPVFEVKQRERGLTIENVPIDPPPEPIPPEAKPASNTRSAASPERVDVTIPILPTTPGDFVLPQPLPPLPPLPPGEALRIDPPAAPVTVEAQLDPRYARDLQPAYPPGERRAEHEGRVTVRVTIGVDGRVTAAECISAASDAFCRATRAQALAKWRFQPATRDGVPVEATKEMTVRFELQS